MSVSDTFKTALVYVFGGAFMLLVLVLFVYLLFVVVDRLSCLNSSTDVLTPHELEQRRSATSLMRRAGIAGLLTDERMRIFRHFFGERAISYQKMDGDDDDTKGINETASNGDDDIEAQKTISQAEASETKSCADENDLKKKDEKPDNSTASTEENSNGDREEGPDNSCPICLNQYDNGEKVMTGTLCSHMFHFECCMQWIEKGNDHCPYCREDMMTPDELLKAAKEEIGDARVEKMIRINQDAARRLSAMQAEREQQMILLQQSSTAAPSAQVGTPETNLQGEQQTGQELSISPNETETEAPPSEDFAPEASAVPSADITEPPAGDVVTQETEEYHQTSSEEVESQKAKSTKASLEKALDDGASLDEGVPAPPRGEEAPSNETSTAKAEASHSTEVNAVS